jgi:hypothetical protein
VEGTTVPMPHCEMQSDSFSLEQIKLMINMMLHNNIYDAGRLITTRNETP